MKQITIIEDNKALSDGIVLALKSEEYSFRQCHTLKEFDFKEKADLIILDINLPDGNGFTFLRRLRQSSSVPVIIPHTSQPKNCR